MYVYQVWAGIFAYIRLRKGLPLTFEIRKQCAIETFKCLFIYAAYLSVVILFFIIISSSNPNPKPHSNLNNFSKFLLFVIANRGSVDGIVWFMLHDFMRSADVKKDDNTLNSNNNNNENKLNRNNNNSNASINELNNITKNNGTVDNEPEDPFSKKNKFTKKNIFTVPLAGK